MKKLISLSVMVLLFFTFISVNAVAADKKSQVAISKSSKIEVYYFHFTRRCMTCNAVENVSKESISTLYPTQTKNGQITFKSVNLDEKSSEILAKKCQAEGQALLVICNEKRFDLTDKGFMYAKSSPEKLKVELKKTIDPLF